MIEITPQMGIPIAVAPVDFRKGIDRLAAMCQQVLQFDPFSGHVFIFRNKKAGAIKVLMYDGQGFWLCQKRLSKGRFIWWPGKTDAALRPLAVLSGSFSSGTGTRQRLMWRPCGYPSCVKPHRVMSFKMMTPRCVMPFPEMHPRSLEPFWPTVCPMAAGGLSMYSKVSPSNTKNCAACIQTPVGV